MSSCRYAQVVIVSRFHMSHWNARLWASLIDTSCVMRFDDHVFTVRDAKSAIDLYANLLCRSGFHTVSVFGIASRSCVAIPNLQTQFAPSARKNFVFLLISELRSTFGTHCDWEATSKGEPGRRCSVVCQWKCSSRWRSFFVQRASDVIHTMALLVPWSVFRSCGPLWGEWGQTRLSFLIFIRK